MTRFTLHKQAVYPEGTSGTKPVPSLRCQKSRVNIVTL